MHFVAASLNPCRRPWLLLGYLLTTSCSTRAQRPFLTRLIQFCRGTGTLSMFPRIVYRSPISVLRFWISEGWTQTVSECVKRWNSQAHTGFPGKFEARNLGRDDLSRESGRSLPSAPQVRREATAVLQHLFRFRSARRTDATGRAITHAEAGAAVRPVSLPRSSLLRFLDSNFPGDPPGT